MICPNCGQENQEGINFCIKCGKSVAQPTVVICPSCGKENTGGALFCAHCGKSVSAPGGSVGYGTPPGTGRGPQPEPQRPAPQSGPFASNIALDVVFTLITCGIYGLFWKARQMKALNTMLGEEKYNFVMWLVVTIVTCGLFNIYYAYIMAQGIGEIQRRRGKGPSTDLPVLCLVLTIFGLHIVADAILQNEINKLA